MKNILISLVMLVAALTLSVSWGLQVHPDQAAQTVSPDNLAWD